MRGAAGRIGWILGLSAVACESSTTAPRAQNGDAAVAAEVGLADRAPGMDVAFAGDTRALPDGGPAADSAPGDGAAPAPDGAAPDALVVSPGGEPIVSGARVRARVRLGADGSREVVGFFDRSLQTSCTFERAEDGKFRCLPSGDADRTLAQKGSVFADPACTIATAWELILGDPSAQPARFVYDYVACAGGRRFAVGRKLEPGSRYRRNSMGACVPAPPTPGARRIEYELGPSVPPTTFEEAAEVRDRVSPRYLAITLVSAGGTRLPLGLFDTELDVACSLDTSRDQVLRCFPRADFQSSATLPSFTDGACSTTVAAFGSNNCRALSTAYVERGENLACGQRYREIYRGGRVIEGVTFLRTPSECRAQPPRSMGSYAVEVGARVPDESMAVFSLVKTGPHRLVPLTYADAQGARDALRWFTPGLFDSARGEICNYTPHADGNLRCLPSVGVHLRYLDAGCTRKVAALPPNPCDVRFRYALALQSVPGAGVGVPSSAWRLFALGERLPNTPLEVYRRQDSGACTPEPVASGAVVHAVGDEVPGAEFVAAREMVE